VASDDEVPVEFPETVVTSDEFPETVVASVASNEFPETVVTSDKFPETVVAMWLVIGTSTKSLNDTA